MIKVESLLNPRLLHVLSMRLAGGGHTHFCSDIHHSLNKRMAFVELISYQK